MVTKKKLDKSNIEDILPLTSMQEAMLFQHICSPDSQQYFEQLCLEANAYIDKVSIEKAWGHVILSNDALRSVFRWEKLDKPVRVVQKNIDSPVRFVDFSGLEEKDKALDDFKITDRELGIDIGSEPFRITLCILGAGRVVMVLSSHHILFDGWSTAVMLREFLECYHALLNDKELPRLENNATRNYLKWYKGQDVNEQTDFWKSYLNGIDSKTVVIPAKRKITEGNNAGKYILDVPDDFAGKLRKFAGENKVTLAAVFYSAWGILMQKYNRSDDVAFGTTVSGRNAGVSGIEKMVGLFINTVPLRVKSGPDSILLEILDAVSCDMRQRSRYENTSLSAVAASIGMSEQEGIFDSIVVVENFPLSREFDSSYEDFKINSYSMFELSNFNLTLAIDAFDSLKFNFIYHTDVFTQESIQRLSLHFMNVLLQLVQFPLMKLSQVDILSGDEKRKIIEEFNDTFTEYPRTKSLGALFEEQAEMFPQRFALVFEGASVTYEQLNKRVNRLAWLLRRYGVGPNRIVGLILDRSIEMIVAILAVLKAGGAYLPIDPAYPMERITSILDDSGTEILLTLRDLTEKQLIETEKLIGQCERKLIFLDEIASKLEAESDDNPPQVNTASDLAYVMYTSGSTGKPKGNLTKHSNISNIVRNTNYIEITPQDVLPQLSNYAFDGSTFDIFGALLNGARLVLVKKDTLLNIYVLSKLIEKEEITLFFITTALFNTLIDINPECLKNVKKILFGGERVSVQHVGKALSYLGQNRLLHVYGPTESTVFATYYPINSIDTNLGTIPIGKPVSNTRIYILDQNNNPVPIETAGELCVSGEGLVRGYLNRQELTSSLFVPNPFEPGQLMYKTGDLARWLPDGNIEFLDRIDGQVKLRGFRIELGEIETQLLKHIHVKETVVVLLENGNVGKYLCAYYVCDTDIAKDALCDLLRKELPAYMVPSCFVRLEVMPLNQNGKIDKKALPEPDFSPVNKMSEYIAPEGKLEENLQTIWQDVLGIEKIGVAGNFFDLGGHSLKATMLASRIYKELDVEVPLKSIFQFPTIRELAAFIEESSASVFESIPKAPEQEYYKASSAQKRIYIQEQFEGIGISYNMPLVFEVEGKADVDRMEYAFNKLIERHETLRTSFHFVDGEIVQKIHNDIHIRIELLECHGGVTANTVEALVKKTAERFFIAFDLGAAPLLRVGMLTTPIGSCYLMMDMHHIISDGISLNVLLTELNTLYIGNLLTFPRIQYKDFSTWQAGLFGTTSFNKRKEFWCRTLHGVIPVLNMPTDFKRSDERTFEGDTVKFVIPAGLVKKLDGIAKVCKATLNILFISAYSILLARQSGQDELVIGSLAAGRTHPDIENVVGMFDDFIPIRTSVDYKDTINEHIGALKPFVLDAYENQDYPYEKMIEDNKIKTERSRNPLFDTMLIFHNQMENSDEIPLGNLKLKRVELDSNTSKLDFKLDIYTEADGGLKCCFEYNCGLFQRETIERLAVHYGNILREIAESPKKRLSEIEMLSAEEKQRILTDYNGTKVPYPAEKTIFHLFEEQVEKTPDNTAVLFGEVSLTYSEFNKRANQLVRVLRKNGIGRGSIVAMLTERSIEMSIGVMAVLKAGGAYLPISSTYPAERIRYMLEDSGAQVLLADSASGNIDGILSNIKIIDLNDENLYTGDVSNPENINESNDLAYVIYTSGSTGKPKGVMIEHHSLVNRLNWMQKKYPIGENDVILQKTTYTFDVSVWELFWWSMTGASLCLLTPGGEKDPGAIVEAVEKYGITTMHFVPSMLGIFLEYVQSDGTSERLKSLKRVFASGEALASKQVEAFNSLLNRSCGATLHNLYGPTEATVDVSYFDCPTQGAPEIVPIGKPIDNINLYIVDKNSGLCPVGVAGELCIAGVGLARGYLNRPELTAERFVTNPFMEETGYPVMYKTGDLARWMPDGNIEYLGRIDYQVKIRGFRIELGEIEAELLKHENVKEAVVAAREDKAGNKYLCAYIVSDEDIETGELREHLKKGLPDYMVPAYFVRLLKMPLSANGKADRKALPEPDINTVADTEYEAPSDEVEQKLAAIWRDILEISKIGINDNFFDLGGHSLTATTLALRIKKEFGVEIPLGELFKNPVISKIAPIIRSAGIKTASVIPQTEREDYYPVSSAQKRIYLLNKLSEDNVTYNLPAVMLVNGNVERQEFARVLKNLIKRHEVLRTSFEFINGEPVQVIHEDAQFEMGYYEVSENDAGKDNIDGMVSKFVRPFDLRQAPLLRAEMVKLDSGSFLLMLDMHHIVSDGISMVVLVREFIQMFQGQELPPLRIQYKDFANWQNKLLASGQFKNQEAYWLEVFKNDIPVLNMPTDYPRPGVQSFEGAKVSTELDEALTKNLKNLALQTQTTLYMVMLSAYYVLLHKYTGQDDIVVGSPMAGRPDAELENLIGMFVNTLAMRNFPKAGCSFIDFLNEVKISSLKAHENQQYQFEELVGKLEIPRDISRNPLFDILFVLQNTRLQEVRMDGLKFEPYTFESKVSKFDLTLEAIEKANTLTLNFEYCTKLFRRETIERLAGHYGNILREIAENPKQKLSKIEMLSAEEKQRILTEYNGTKAPYPAEKTIFSLFEEQVEKTPDNTAVMFGEVSLTYSEFNKRVNQLARVLRKNGIGRGSIVAMSTERTLEMSIGVMAVLKAGGAYLPISPTYPVERIRYMLEDSGAQVLLAEGISADGIYGDVDGFAEAAASLASSAKSDELAGLSNINIINLNDENLYTGDGSNLENINEPNDLAYVIYTSGSTGKPKGVMIEHHSLVNRLNWMQRKYPIGENDVILQKTTYTFDVSVWELFWWSMTGASLCLLAPGGEKDPSAIVAAVEKYSITTMHFVPSMLGIFLEYVQSNSASERLKSLKRVFASGEALNPKQAEAFNRLLNKCNGTTLHNLYGPTEATVDVSYFDCPTQEAPEIVPIGKPIDNINLYIVDKNGGLCSVGVAGELCIAGVGLARGYLNRPELTAERFVINPFMEETGYPVMYKTGDLARWLPDGNIEYLGRIDYQVKIRGFRIELGEIEAELLKHENVKEAVVAAREDKVGNKYLCAYIVADVDIETRELREHLKKGLPDYMVPAYFVSLPKMPLSANGKADRKALPEPDVNMENRSQYTAPVNEIEKTLVEIWKDVLGREIVGTGDNFFDIGGNSLLLVRVHTRLNELFNGRIKVTDLFVYPTISALAEFISASAGSENTIIRLNPVTLPDEYFTVNSDLSKSNVLEFRLGEELCEKLQSLAADEKVEAIDILISAYSYMFAQVTKNYSITVQVSGGKKDSLIQMPLKLDTVKNYSELYSMVNQKRHEVALTYSAADASKLVEKANLDCVFPLFYESNTLSGKFGLDRTFGIVAEMLKEDNTAILSFEYDAARLAHDKVKNMMDIYIKIILLFLQK